ncbi:hypothetical protein F5Y13DRAFT_151793 [Hypoxylon sp. FL1857]|nr:hypothetical protein F5Y13DRAFT_151793 [Hypoxylon sp. FL1857]
MLRSSDFVRLLASSSHLSPLTLEATNSLLSPFSSHLGDDDYLWLLVFDALLNGIVVTKVVWWMYGGL